MVRLCGALLGTLVICTWLATGIQSRTTAEQQQQGDEFAAFLPAPSSNALLLESNDVADSGPPPHTEYAKMARYLVHKAEWVSMGSLSTVEAIKGYPMVNIIAVADSARGEKSTGTLYFYLTMLDYTAQDLSKDNRLTVLLSMDQDLYCSQRGVDPMEPTCARIMISGRAVKLEDGDAEFNFGKNAMFSRHPAAKKWLNTHNFFLCKLEITQIAVLDWYGGPHYVTLEDYMKADPDAGHHTTVLKMAQPEFEREDDSDARTITLKIKKDSTVRHINLEV